MIKYINLKANLKKNQKNKQNGIKKTNKMELKKPLLTQGKLDLIADFSKTTQVFLHKRIQTDRNHQPIGNRAIIIKNS